MKRIVVFLTILILSSCVTTPEVIIVTENRLPQEVTFPEIPKIEGIEYSEDEQIVFVPSYIWIKIAEYMLEVKKTEELYKLFRQ